MTQSAVSESPFEDDTTACDARVSRRSRTASSAGALENERERAELQALLDRYFAELDPAMTACQALWKPALAEPVAGFLSRPSKRFRARLVEVSWHLGGRRSAAPRELPLIIEALHAGSLIIDDIEDGSAYRRGAPALHVQAGLPVALNAGNWLYFWPAWLLARLGLPPATELRLHRSIGNTLLACHGGQALDLSVRVTDLAQADVTPVVKQTTQLKTGKLFELATELGAVAAGAPSHTLRALAEFGRALGTGLQMLDDLGGISSETRRHKGHEDLLNASPTWPWAWAAERLDAASFGDLRARGREVAERDCHPEVLAAELRDAILPAARVTVSEHFEGALSTLRAKIGRSAPLEAIEHEVRVMEQSYG